MQSVQRVGDVNTAGGVAQVGVDSVRINGRAVVVNGNPVTPHPCCGQRRCPSIHCHATTANGSSSILAGGIPVVRTGDCDTCGHPRAGGSADVRIN
jgi:uncharacterized Zn-binding protein involved in type VI secretion